MLGCAARGRAAVVTSVTGTLTCCHHRIGHLVPCLRLQQQGCMAWRQPKANQQLDVHGPCSLEDHTRWPKAAVQGYPAVSVA